MKGFSIGVVVLLLAVLTINAQGQRNIKQILTPRHYGYRSCQNSRSLYQLCFCGKTKVIFNRLSGNRCVNGQVVQKKNPKSNIQKIAGLRLATKALHISTRDDNKDVPYAALQYKSLLYRNIQTYLPLRSVSVDAWIDSFAADVTLTQVFVNQEQSPIEAIYVFPIEENAAVYSFTAEIENRTITAVVKEKNIAEREYKLAVQQGRTAVLLQQSKETLDTFSVNVGALPPGKECRVTIKYVTELDLIDGSAIRFVVPTTIAPRYNPSLGHVQASDLTRTKYVQNTSYSMSFHAHILRGEQNTIMQVANLSHAVDISLSRQSIDVSIKDTALDRDIILDIDLPENGPAATVTIEESDDSSQHAILLAFTPSISDFMDITNGEDEPNAEFFFIVDCSGSMYEANRIGLAREAMLLFIHSLPVGSNFNIIRFGSNYDILFKNGSLAVLYDANTAAKAMELSRSMSANLGGTELLKPLKYLKDHPPTQGRTRQIFLLTDGEVSNTNEVIDLCRSMASTTRIFSFGLGHTPSRSLVKGLARATNGYFVFVPPEAKVDEYVASQLGRALQPSLVNARLQWHGLSTNRSQAPTKIPPLYVNDRVLVYGLLEGNKLKKSDISVDLIVNHHKICSIKLSGNIVHKKDIIRRLAAKALIQELIHEKKSAQDDQNNSTLEQRITTLSLKHQILSPYTAFVGVETTGPKINNTNSTIHHIQTSTYDEDECTESRAAYHSISQRPGAAGVAEATGVGNSGFFFGSRGSLSVLDTVRWLIDQQSFNGAWLLNEKDIAKLTSGKSLSTFQSTITQNKDALTTALAIAILESKYVDKKNLWNAVVMKGRKRLNSFDLSNGQVNLLINEIKNKL